MSFVKDPPQPTVPVLEEVRICTLGIIAEVSSKYKYSPVTRPNDPPTTVLVAAGTKLIINVEDLRYEATELNQEQPILIKLQ